MLLLLEIWLAVKAFRSGWRWRVLWPFAAVFVLAALVVAGGGSADQPNPAYLLGDAGLILALVAMIRHAPDAGRARSSLGEPRESVPEPDPQPALDRDAA